MHVDTNSGLYLPEAAGTHVIRAAGVWTMKEHEPFIAAPTIICRNGRIVEIRPSGRHPHGAQVPETNLGKAILAPGLINAHTHLNLSHTAGKTARGKGFLPWLKSLVPMLYTSLDNASLSEAVTQVRDGGTAFAADITRNSLTKVSLAMQEQGLAHMPMIEFFGFPEDAELSWPEEVAPPSKRGAGLAVSGHALYSTSPQLLSQAKAWAIANQCPYAIHLAESPEEVELTTSGEGEMFAFFRQAGIIPPGFEPPGFRPVAYAHSLGLLDAETLAIHCVQISQDEIATLAKTGTNVCLCPRSNEYIGVGRAPWEDILDAGINTCLGTDGLSSNMDLNLLNELRFLRRHFKGKLGLRKALELVTVNPAKALGIAEDYGEISPGKKAVFCVLPEDIRSWDE